MAGTISLSLTQRLDKVTNKPLIGGRVYFYQAGTVATPQNAYQDINLTVPHPNPLTLADGNIPQLFFADGLIKVKILSKTGVEQINADNILVMGPSDGGGGGGGTVDPTTIWRTGDLKHRFDEGDHSGWVPANGETIGSATSGATGRANADTQDLFIHLWSAGLAAGLVVTPGGRGANPNADWVANKAIELPDYRGRTLSGTDSMGASASNRLTSAHFVNPDSVGMGGGRQSQPIVKGNLPAITIPVSGSVTVNSTNNTNQINTGGDQFIGSPGGSPVPIKSSGTITSSGSFSTATDALGSGTDLTTLGPRGLCTIYIKL